MNPVIYLLIADVLLAVTGQLLLKKGMSALGPLDFNLANIWHLCLAAMKIYYIWVAVACYVLGLVIWMFVLSNVKLSVAYPVTALVYILVIFGSWLFFKESIGMHQMVGTALVIIGLAFIFKGL